MSTTATPSARRAHPNRLTVFRALPTPGGARPRPAATALAERHFHHLLLALLLVLTLVLRLWGIKQGLPFSYDVDEAAHFVPRAIAFFSHDLNPQYFLNPPAYSYVLHIVFELWFGSGDAVARIYTTDPTTVFVVARVVASVLGTVAVWLVYLAGERLFDRWIGLLAAAIFGLAFLPIYYSHLALNDTPTLAPVALSLWGIAGVMRRGRMRDYVIAGAGIGLAAATKYTGGITLVCLLVAAVCDAAGSSARGALKRTVVGLVVALAAFVIANPYSALDWHDFWYGITQQASLAAGSEPFKLGTTSGSGITYYLNTFTWGLGWAPTIAAVGGTALLIARRRFAMVLLLLPAVIAFIVFMGDQQRFFGRWLMPVFPIVALLAAYGAVELVRILPRARFANVAVAGAIVAVVMLAQSVSSVIHDDLVLSRPDTRNLVRAWMVTHIPAGTKVVVEPDVPANWDNDIGSSLQATPSGARWVEWNTSISNIGNNGKPLPHGQTRYVPVDEYERILYPGLLTAYVQQGFCWVMTGSLQAGRAYVQPQLAPGAIAYYAALRRQATLVYQVSPYAKGARPVPFNFDWAIDYYPEQYRLPGPQMYVWRLKGCGAA